MTSPTCRLLARCPDRPNCVSSQAPPGDARHYVEPLRCAGDALAAWQALRVAVAQLPRTRIVEDSADYLHAEVRSRLFHFVDDLECVPDPAHGVIHVRSAARVGYGDFGVNRRRVQRLRRLLAQAAPP